MSISNLFIPNNFTLYCDTLNANTAPGISLTNPTVSGTMTMNSTPKIQSVTTLEIDTPGLGSDIKLNPNNNVNCSNRPITDVSQLALIGSTTQLSIQPGGVGNAFIFDCANPAGIRILTLPDPLVSNSNFLYDTLNQSISGIKTFNGGINLLTSGGTPTLLNFNETITHTTTWQAGNAASGNTSIFISRNGDCVILKLPSFSFSSGTGTTTITSNTAIPARFRPASSCWTLMRILDSTIPFPCTISIDSTGILTIFRLTAATYVVSNFSDTALLQLDGGQITYVFNL